MMIHNSTLDRAPGYSFTCQFDGLDTTAPKSLKPISDMISMSQNLATIAVIRVTIDTTVVVSGPANKDSV